MLRRVIRSPWVKLLAALIVAAFWAILIRRQLTALNSYTWNIAPPYLLLALGCAAGYFGGLALCWSLLLSAMTTAKLNLATASRIWLMSMISRYVPGNVWHIVSRAAMAARLGVSAPLVVASATIEQGLTLAAAFGIVAATLPWWPEAALLTMDSRISRQIWLPILVLGLLLLHPHILGRVLRWMSKLTKRPELAWNYHYPTMLALLLGYGATTVLQGFALAAVLAGTTTFSIAQVPFALGAAALAWALGYLSFLTPGGLGVREGVLAALLAQIMPVPAAIVASVIFRLICTLGELVAVGVAWALRDPAAVTVPTGQP
jgi:uncharacterized membrane protein YbhN (UPF0104 family)